MAQFEAMLGSFRPNEMLLRSGVAGGISGGGRGRAPARYFFHFVAQNADICRVLLCGPQETAFVGKVNQLVRERVLDEWAALMGKGEQAGLRLRVFIFVAGCIGLLKQWLEQGMPLAPDEMAAVVEGHHHQRCSGPAIAAPRRAYPSLERKGWDGYAHGAFAYHAGRPFHWAGGLVVWLMRTPGPRIMAPFTGVCRWGNDDGVAF